MLEALRGYVYVAAVRCCVLPYVAVLYMDDFCDRLHSAEILRARAYGRFLYNRLHSVEVLHVYQRVSFATRGGQLIFVASVLDVASS